MSQVFVLQGFSLERDFKGNLGRNDMSSLTLTPISTQSWFWTEFTRSEIAYIIQSLKVADKTSKMILEVDLCKIWLSEAAFLYFSIKL